MMAEALLQCRYGELAPDSVDHGNQVIYTAEAACAGPVG